MGHGERPAVAGVDGSQEGLADGSGQSGGEGAVARLGRKVEIFGQRRHLEELRDAVLDPRRPVRHPLLVRGDSRDALQVSTVSSSAAPPDRAPVCTIHDTEHRASLYASLRRASFSVDSRRRFRLFTWFTCDVRPCVCDGEMRFGEDGARLEARHTRGVREKVTDISGGDRAGTHHDEGDEAEEREGRDEPRALDVAIVAPQREAVIQPGPAPAGEQRRVFVGAPHRDVIATPAARGERIHAEVGPKSDRQPVVGFHFRRNTVYLRAL